jgi:hypothetical protein
VIFGFLVEDMRLGGPEGILELQGALINPFHIWHIGSPQLILVHKVFRICILPPPHVQINQRLNQVDLPMYQLINHKNRVRPFNVLQVLGLELIHKLGVICMRDFVGFEDLLDFLEVVLLDQFKHGVVDEGGNFLLGLHFAGGFIVFL